METNTLQRFAQANDAAAATTKKLQKQAILGDYFRELAEADLRLAVRYAAGRAFAETDERVLNVGGALVGDLTAAMVAMEPKPFHALVVRSGEIGEALAAVWEQRPKLADVQPAPPADDALAFLAPPKPKRGGTVDEVQPLRLADLSAAFDVLAITGNRERKRAILQALFNRCTRGREAAYLAKIIFGDLRTGAQEGVLQAAVAIAFAKPLPEVQRCQLLVGDLDEVAVLARSDALAAAAFRLFHPIQFMLATPQETPADAAETLGGRPFFAEDKLDGIRAQIHKSGEGSGARVAIYTRTMDRADASFPDVVSAVSCIPGDFLLDGEIVPYRDGQVLPFAHIQKRLGRKKVTSNILRENPAVFIAFDILYRDGALLMDKPLRERRTALANLCGVDPDSFSTFGVGRWAFDVRRSPEGERTPNIERPTPNAEPGMARSPTLVCTSAVEVVTVGEVEAVFADARDRRNEGVILKNPDSLYSPGRRGQWWLKLKTHLPTFDCVVTAAETGHGKRRNSLSDYTFAVWDSEPADADAKLVNIGKAYSGLTDEEIAQMTELFTQLTRAQHGRVRLVEPQVVLEIACDTIQRSARHASGYALRFPRIKRIRWDKKPADADRLARIAEIYESTSNFAKANEKIAMTVSEATLFD